MRLLRNREVDAVCQCYGKSFNQTMLSYDYKENMNVLILTSFAVSERVECSAGHYSLAQSTFCTACSAGYTCEAGSTTATETICPMGMYCPDGLNEESCPRGTYMDLEGSDQRTDCIPCRAG